MGACLSKKSVCASSTPVSVPEKVKSETQLDMKKPEEETVVKKEFFVIKHRKSHEIERPRLEEENVGHVQKPETEVVPNALEIGEPVTGNGPTAVKGGGAVVRTSSCTKEEVDAILIQCGRLSRSSSTGKAAENGGRKYSGSKRSYDFDNDSGKTVEGNEDDPVAMDRENRHRQRNRQSQGRRRTPSRERERDQAAAAAQQRSGSRERGSGGGSRRVSRSPGRRSESPITTANSNGSGTNSNSSSRPGKMVSVPATVSSLAMDKSNNGGGGGENVKRIQVKRNTGGGGEVAAGTRTGASPRARSPARIRASSNENAGGQNQLQPMSLSRSNSRKAENSPYRRNPLAEIETNIITPQAASQSQKPYASETRIEKQMNNSRTDKNKDKQQQQPTAEENKKEIMNVGLNLVSSSEILKQPNNNNPAAVTRSRSSRLSRDLDIINPESLSSNPPAASSYTALLLEDIHNFHQKNTPTTTLPPTGFSLPPCVTKACSILEAVADLNSSTGSNLSTTLSHRNPINPNPVEKIGQETKDPFLESEIVVKDDLMEPSFHKYVTVRRGGDELEEQESSGSNSFVGSQQQWLSSSSWEPNSAESTDRWTSSSSSSSSSKLVSRKNESGRGGVDEGAKGQMGKNQQNGIGRGRIGSRGSHMAAASS